MKHGGVAIYKRQSLQSTINIIPVLDFCREGILECCCIEIVSYKIILAVIYRPPSDNFNLFLSLCNGLLNKIVNSNRLVILGGDFNLDFLSINRNVTLFTDLLLSYELNVTIKVPTRITEDTSTCIDNFIVSSNCNNYVAKTIDLNLSDHISQLLIIATKKITEKNTYTYRRNLCQDNIRLFTSNLEKENWEQVFNETCPNSAFDIFLNILLYNFEQCFPVRRFLNKHKYEGNEWITEELLQMKSRISFYNDLAKTHPEYKDLSRVANNNYKKKLESAKKEYHDREIREANNKTKTMWNIISKLQGKERQQKYIHIVQNDTLISDEEAANNFNEHFINSQKNMNLAKDFDFLRSNIPVCHRSFFLAPLTETDVLTLINNLKSSNACGYDEISNNLIKKCKFSLSSPLTHIINLSFQTGTFPTQFKLAIVLPLYKKGDPNDYQNYRAINLLPSLSKLFELSVKEQLTVFLNQNNILSPTQHGFTKSKSTETALCAFHERIVNAMDNKQYTIGLFVDFSRAFDCVDHELLLEKLNRYGIRGIPLKFFTSYLENRNQIVKLNDVYSNKYNVDKGVPQGSILGPLLFLIFANDLAYFLKNTPGIYIVTYADDTNLLLTERAIEPLRILTEKTYQNIITWAEKNCLYLNKSKTTYLPFSIKKTTTDFENGFARNDNADVVLSTSTKILGVHFDRNLQWDCHIDVLTKKLTSSCYGLRFLTNHCSRDILLTLYYANFHSHMRYGIINWGNSTHIHRVFVLQKYAVRIIAKLNYRDSCRDAFKQLRILSVASTYIFEVCSFIYNNKSLFSVYNLKHEYHTRHKDILQPNSHRTTMYQKNFFYNGCKLYNALSNDITSSGNIHIFKKRLKEYLVYKNCYSVNDFFL